MDQLRCPSQDVCMSSQLPEQQHHQGESTYNMEISKCYKSRSSGKMLTETEKEFPT